jgi:hypothetical protein
MEKCLGKKEKVDKKANQGLAIPAALSNPQNPRA